MLESYFKKYPDVPEETILKQHLLSLGHWFSDAALRATAGALVKSYRLFSYDLVPMADLKRGEHRRVPEHFVLLNGPYGMRPVAIQTSLSPHSPYLIDVVDGRLVMTTEGRVLAEVRFPKTPDYYAKSLPDGTPYHEIVAFGTFITIFRNCQYWGAREECKFCDINENARQMKLSRDFTLTAPVKSVEDVVRVCDEVASDARRHGVSVPGFVLSGGSITKTLHGKSEVDFYEEYIRAIKGSSAKPRITFEVNARPRAEVERYKAAGADNIHFNMEVWEKRLFEWINPGKASRIGWDNWVRWMCEAVEVFGKGSVQPSFVSGVEMARPHGYQSVAEAVKSTSTGFEYLMSRGMPGSVSVAPIAARIGASSGAGSRRRRCARRPSSRRFHWTFTCSSRAIGTSATKNIARTCPSLGSESPGCLRSAAYWVQFTAPTATLYC